MTVQRIAAMDEAMNFMLPRIDGYRPLSDDRKAECIPLRLIANGGFAGYSLVVPSLLDPRACSIDVALEDAYKGWGGLLFRQLLAYAKENGYTRVLMPVVLGSPVDGYLRRLNPSFTKLQSDTVAHHVFNLRRWE